MGKKPDWRILDDYPDSSASMEELAWEFLRRNPAYQIAYDRYKKLLDKELVLEGGDINYAYWCENNNISMLHYEVDPPARKNEKSGGYRARIDCKNVGFTISISNNAFPPSSDFGLDHYVNPYSSYRKVESKINFLKREIRYEHVKPNSDGSINNSRRVSLSSEEVGEAIVIFDVRLSVSKQLQVAKKYLKELEKELKKNKGVQFLRTKNGPNFIKQLRALDADNLEVPHKDVASELFPRFIPNTHAEGYPGNIKVRDAITAGKKLALNPLKLLLIK